MISAENVNYSNHLDARDQLNQVFGDVRLMGRMGSHPTSPTKLRNSCPGEPQLARRIGPVLDATSVDGVLNLVCERQHDGHACRSANWLGYHRGLVDEPLRVAPADTLGCGRL